MEPDFPAQRIALAGEYLGKLRPAIDALRQSRQPDIEHGDAAYKARTELEADMLRAKLRPMMRTVRIAAISEVGRVEAAVYTTAVQAAGL